MGRHRQDLEFDPDGLRPPTVEELAAQERAEKPRREAVGHRKPLLVALSTSALLVAGASAFALARSQEPAILVEPNGAAAPFGVGYKDGFGEHVAKPSWSPSPRKSTTAKPGTQSPLYVPPAPEAPPTLGTLEGSGTPSVKPSSPLTASSSAPSNGDSAPASLTAVHWEMTFQDRYWVYVWVNNAGKTPATWQVTLTLPKKAKVTSVWAVSKVTKADGTIVLTPPKGTLAPGLTYLFAIEGISPDPFKLQNCTVNGSTCVPF
jgi:hypothetical protein